MKILVLGGDGMLGHVLLRELGSKHDLKVTLRNNIEFYNEFGLFNLENSFDEFEPMNSTAVQSIFCKFRPDVVINALGLIKQREKSEDKILSLAINSLFPHKIAQICGCIGARLIHLSTDCVFSGGKGRYVESDVPDAVELYGRTKYLGECDYEHSVTLRTSFFGTELRHKSGLIEWFLAQSGSIKGFSNAIYSGLSTSEMSNVIDRVITDSPDISGLWHVSSDPIDKYTLLVKLSEYLGRSDIEIKEDASFLCDRSLDSQRFRNLVGYQPPTWDNMLKELAKQITQGV